MILWTIMNQIKMMFNEVDGYLLRYCKKCKYVWEKPYDRHAVTIIKYSNLSSYKLKRQQCLECEREINGTKTNTCIGSERLVTKYY